MEELIKNLKQNLNDYFRVPVENYLKVPWVPIQWVLDKGLPFGRIVEIYGPEQSGKSTFAYQALGELIKNNGIGVVIDTEGSFVPSWIKQLGLDPEKFVVVSPECMEDVFEAFKRIIDTVPQDVPLGIVWDSVIGTPTRSQLEGKTEMATAARVLSSYLPRITNILYERQALALFINQARTLLNIYGHTAIDSSGGYALRHSAAMRIMFQKGSKLMKGDEIMGHEISINVVKSKVGEPYRYEKVPFLKRKGFDRTTITIFAAQALGIVETKGAWLKWRELNFQKWNTDGLTEEGLIEIEEELRKHYEKRLPVKTG